MESLENNLTFISIKEMLLFLTLQLKVTYQRDYASKNSYFCGKIIEEEENLF